MLWFLSLNDGCGDIYFVNVGVILRGGKDCRFLNALVRTLSCFTVEGG